MHPSGWPPVPVRTHSMWVWIRVRPACQLPSPSVMSPRLLRPQHPGLVVHHAVPRVGRLALAPAGLVGDLAAHALDAVHRRLPRQRHPLTSLHDRDVAAELGINPILDALPPSRRQRASSNGSTAPSRRKLSGPRTSPARRRPWPRSAPGSTTTTPSGLTGRLATAPRGSTNAQGEA